MYKFSRGVFLFVVFAVNWSSAKFSSSNCYLQNFDLHILESRKHVDGYVRHLQDKFLTLPVEVAVVS